MDENNKDALTGSDLSDIETIDINPISSDEFNNMSTINIDDILKGINGTFNIGTTMNAGATGANYSYGNSTISGPSGPYYYTTGPYITTVPNTNGWGTITTGGSSNAGLHVTSDAEFDGDVRIKGKSLLKMLETIEKRLSILQPDPKKLEHFEALRKAYEHYKTLEALCELPKEPKE